MTTPDLIQQPALIVGIDAHQRTHHAVIIDTTGRRVADQEFAVSTDGYAALTAWALDHGIVTAWALESTGSYAAGLTRHLLVHGLGDVFEVNRPDKTVRARDGKNDPIDAEAAARAVLSGRATARPKVTTGVVESIRMLMLARNSAVKARTALYSQIRDLITTAPAEIHDTLIGMTAHKRVEIAAGYRPDPARLAEPVHAAKHALRALARRIRDLTEEIRAADKTLGKLVADTVPTLIAKHQIGTITAAQLLVTAGQNLDRMRNEASFAKLTGTAPVPASSGKTRRMRLSRGGDRQANKALHLIAVGRIRSHPETITYTQRRTRDGLGKKDIIRCLKRAIAREAYRALKTDLLRA